jgi:hypothetical protein
MTITDAQAEVISGSIKKAMKKVTETLLDSGLPGDVIHATATAIVGLMALIHHKVPTETLKGLLDVAADLASDKVACSRCQRPAVMSCTVCLSPLCVGHIEQHYLVEGACQRKEPKKARR